MISFHTFPKFIINNSFHNLIDQKELFIKGFKNQNHFFFQKKNRLLFSTNKSSGFILEILFHGLNFNAKRIKMFRPKYFIDVHKSEIFIFHEKASHEFKSRIHKRRLFFFSFNKNLLKIIKTKIKEFRFPNIYTGKGIFEIHDSYQVKEGKVRKKS